MSINAGDPGHYQPYPVSLYIEWPEIHSMGLSYKIGPLLLAFDVDYIKWASSWRSVDMRFTEAAYVNPLGFILSEFVLNVSFRDQPVYKLGLEYVIKKRYVLRFGFSHNPSAITSAGVSPLMPAVFRNTVTMGFGLLGKHWDLDMALGYELPSAVESDVASDWQFLHAAEQRCSATGQI